jgi:hypothetical protein
MCSISSLIPASSSLILSITTSSANSYTFLSSFKDYFLDAKRVLVYPSLRLSWVDFYFTASFTGILGDYTHGFEYKYINGTPFVELPP